MKRLLIAATMAVITVSVSTSIHATGVGVSVDIGEPGFYGRLDIGNYPRPQVIYRRPIVVERVAVDRPPIYLRVPPGHAKHWRQHCRRYDACGERVYFVQDGWYAREYVPRYRRQHGDRHHDRRHDRRDDDRRREDRSLR